MSKDLTVFKYTDKQIRTLLKDGEPWWVLKDVCDVLDLSNPSIVAARLDSDEVTKFDLGGLSGESNIINESGLYNVILRSDKPEAKNFKRWVTHEVLPAIRKTGGYSVKENKDTEIKLMNAKSRQAKILLSMIIPEMPDTYKQILRAKASEIVTGQALLPLPAAERKTYTAAEVADRLGISAQKVGIFTNKLNLKTEEFGKWCWDKAAYSAKEVRVFRYYDNIFETLKNIIGGLNK